VIRRLRLLLAASIVLASCGGGGEASQPGGAAGERLPDVELVPLAGGAPIQLSDVAGPAVVNLWATWCAPCRAEIPDFENVHQARGDEVRFVGVNIGEDGDRAASFIDEVGATYDQFLDSEGFVVTELRTSTMPVTIVIDADGVIATRHLGPLDEDGLNDAIDEALAG